MCGIVGCAGDLTVQHEKIMRTLLILDSTRGEDSTGVAVIGKWEGNVKIAKQVGDPFQLFDHKSYDKAFSGMQRAIIGHNRWATVGQVVRQNAHPFENNSVVGVHNGTLKSKHLLADASQFKVDSENIYHAFDKHGVQDTMNYMNGAWALVWWDKDDQTINFLRNNERPLWMVRSDDGKVLFWASEHWMLDVALSKHGVKFGRITLLQEDVHHSIHVNNKGELDKVHVRNAPSTYVAPVHVAVTNQFARPNGGPDAGAPTTPPSGNAGSQVPAVVGKPAGTVQLNLVKGEPAAATVKKPEQAVCVVPCDRSFLSAKNICIETLSSSKDEDGTSYIACFDPHHEYYEIRLYARPADPVWDLIGCDIKCDIGVFSPHKHTPGRGYYKVKVDSITIIVPAVADELVDTPILTIKGPTGRDLDEKAFNREYPSCAWCSSPLDFFDRNKFSTGSECFCPSCTTNKDVLEAVSF